MSFTTFTRKYFGWFVTLFVKLVANINWTNPRPITAQQSAYIAAMLKDNYFLICTHARSHLATYTINLSDLFFTHKWGFYDHCLMNLEDTGSPMLCEATLFRGVNFDDFATIFTDVDAVALMKPKSMALSDWTLMLDRAKSDVGKPYDTLYDFTQANRLSCIELVRNCLQADPNYATNFANFEALLAKYGELTPQMLYDCPDFEVVWECKVP